MDAAELREVQAVVKERYRQDRAAARTPLQAMGSAGEGVDFLVQQYDGTARAGLHAATGGDGTAACSGDMLMEALLGCAGVTLNAVATAFGVPLANLAGTATGTFDARGTLGVDREVPVGVTDVLVSFEADTDAAPGVLAKLAAATERFCVVGQSLATPPRIQLIARA